MRTQIIPFAVANPLCEQRSTKWTIQIANEASFWPAEFKDPAFNNFALRTALCLANLSRCSSEKRMLQIICAGGKPCPAWLSSLMFMVELAKSGKKGGAL